jgi:hypothetical protein
VLFLAGLGRSGSTLLERLLGQLPGVQTLGETVHLWVRSIRDNERCGCGPAFRDCEFWPQVGEAAFGGWDRVDVARVESLRASIDRLRHIPAVIGRASPDLAEYTDYYARLYAASHQVSGAQWLVDSSKHPSMAHCLRRNAAIDLRVVHVVRHPGAAAYSWTKVVRRPDVVAGSRSDQLMTRYSPSRTAALWDAENAATGSLRRLGVPVLRVRYEDLVADPQRSLRDVVSFMDLPASTPLPLDGATAQLAATHTASGNPMRFTTGAITIRADERWREQLPARDRRLVAALTWPLARAYGY